MYFFYFDESGTRDPGIVKNDPETGESAPKDHLYVLLAICLHESRWSVFDQEITRVKLKMRARLHQQKGVELASLADCEVKSTALRFNKTPDDKGYSPFIHNLEPHEKTELADLYYSQIEKHHMRIFATAVDKRCLKPHVTAETLHKKAYELTLERIEHFMREYHPNQRGLVVMDNTQKQLNHAVAMKHAWFLREGNNNIAFTHLIEYPFFTDSKLSTGIQIADLCAYNVYRALRTEDYSYSYFSKLLPSIYRSRRTPADKLDGLKIWPDASAIISSAQDAFRQYSQQTSIQPDTKNAGLDYPYRASNEAPGSQQTAENRLSSKSYL